MEPGLGSFACANPVQDDLDSAAHVDLSQGTGDDVARTLTDGRHDAMRRSSRLERSASRVSAAMVPRPKASEGALDIDQHAAGESSPDVD
jgi:hypothetical protein